MTRKAVVFRTVASRDVREATDYYTDAVDANTALRFTRAVDATTESIAISPKLGSPRYAELASVPGLRNRKLQQFPYVVLYLEHDDHIEIARVLHTARDIPVWLKKPDSV